MNNWNSCWGLKKSPQPPQCPTFHVAQHFPTEPEWGALRSLWSAVSQVFQTLAWTKKLQESHQKFWPQEVSNYTSKPEGFGKDLIEPSTYSWLAHQDFGFRSSPRIADYFHYSCIVNVPFALGKTWPETGNMVPFNNLINILKITSENKITETVL